VELKLNNPGVGKYFVFENANIPIWLLYIADSIGLRNTLAKPFSGSFDV